MTNNLAIVFPGQGSQSTGMLAEFYDRFATFKHTLEESSDALGYDLWDLIVNDEKKLNNTQYTQPSLLAVSVALWKVWLEEGGIKPTFFAGHSLGEYSALVAANSISLTTAIKLVAERGCLMQLAVDQNKGAMAAIIGLENNKVESICEEISVAKTYVAPANYNAPGQVVIAGVKEAVEKASALAKENGARMAVLLPVSVPSHCALMQTAADELSNVLQDIEFKIPEIAIIHNFDVAVRGGDRANGSQKDIQSAIRDVLVQQLYNPVRWTETVELLAKNGITKIIECGPGKVLTGLNKRIAKNIVSTAMPSVENFETELTAL